MSTPVGIVKCLGYDPILVQQALENLIQLLGGLERFILPGSRVLVKPNLLMSKGPECAITTHPEVVRAVIRMLKTINCKIIVGDGPSVWGKYVENVNQVYEVTGIKQVCDTEGVTLVNFDKRRMRSKFPLTVWLDNCDYLINLPKFKTHEFTLLTGGIKNLFGLVSGTYKTELHKNYFEPQEFAKILVDIYAEVKPTLTIVDGVLALEGDGPATAGKARWLNLLLGGTDCVAIDSVMAKIMGIKAGEVFTTKEAARRVLGEERLENIQVLGENLEQLNTRPFILPTTQAKARKFPKVLKKILKGLIRYYPYVLRAKCIRCGHCIEVCPGKCIKLRREKIVFNYRRCIACFCCQESCPEAAIKVKKSFFARLIGL